MLFWRKHPVSESDLSAFLDGEQEEAARARVQAHIEACAACRETLDELRAVRQGLRELPRAAAPRSFVLRAAEVRPAGPAPSVGLVRAAPLLAGVATLAFVAFWVLVGVDLGQPAEKEARQATSTEFAGQTDSIQPNAPEGQPAAPQADANKTVDAGEEQGFAEATPGGRGEAPAELDAGAPATGYAATPSPEAAVSREAREPEGGGSTGLRAAEAAMAALALVAGGSAALVWRRRRT